MLNNKKKFNLGVKIYNPFFEYYVENLNNHNPTFNKDNEKIAKYFSKK